MTSRNCACILLVLRSTARCAFPTAQTFARRTLHNETLVIFMPANASLAEAAPREITNAIVPGDVFGAPLTLFQGLKFLKAV